MNDRVLYEILIQVGRIVDLHILRDKETSRPKGYAFAEYETEEILQPVNSMRNNIILFLVFVTIFTIILSVYLARSISKPIVYLRDTAQKISEGNLYTEITKSSKDEIGDLTNSFDKMSQNLIKQHENLEELVDERTNDLEKKTDELERYKKVTVNRELKMIDLKKRIKELDEASK